MAKEYKLDIFQTLAAIDLCKGGWLAQQSPEARRAFAPLTVLRWAVAVPDSELASYGLLLANERVNLHLWKLQQGHPELIFRLLASCGFGKTQRHSWLAGPTGRTAIDKARALLATAHPECNDDEITILLSQHDSASFKRFVNECGVQPDDAKAILAAFNEQSGQSSGQDPDKASQATQGRKAKGRATTAAKM